MSSEMRRICLARRPTGMPVPEDFSLETVPMPELIDGHVLVEVSHFSLDPYMRGRMDDVKSYAPSVGLGEVMTAQGIGRVLASKHADFAAGDAVIGVTGWASHAALPGAELRTLPDGVPATTALGALGMPGLTAWTGLRNHADLKSGETLVVAAATGPVGSMVGQLAKAAGLRTIAIAGGPDKCSLATEHFGFDAALDHRAYDTASALRKALAEVVPNGIDIYWENVGGKVLEAVLPLMNTHGRIPVCGTIAWYGGGPFEGPDRLPTLWRSILVKRLRVSGMIVFDDWDQTDAFLTDMVPRVAAGDIAYLEDVAEGIDTAAQAFIKMLAGGNTGKQLVRV